MTHATLPLYQQMPPNPHTTKRNAKKNNSKNPPNRHQGGEAKEEKPEIIISHSFGSVVTAGVLRRNPDIEVKDWIMVTTPHNFRERILDVSKALNVTNRTVDRLIKFIEDSTGEHIDDLNMSEFTRDLPNLDQALIIHSKQDKILPIETSRMVHETMPKSELIELENLGHYKILWADEVISIIKERIT